jgi:hypothetical protein
MKIFLATRKDFLEKLLKNENVMNITLCKRAYEKFVNEKELRMNSSKTNLERTNAFLKPIDSLLAQEYIDYTNPTNDNQYTIWWSQWLEHPDYIFGKYIKDDETIFKLFIASDIHEWTIVEYNLPKIVIRQYKYNPVTKSLHTSNDLPDTFKKLYTYVHSQQLVWEHEVVVLDEMLKV